MDSQDSSRSKNGQDQLGSSLDCRRDRSPRFENVDESTARAFSALGRMMHANRLAMARLSGNKGPHHGKMIALALIAGREGISQTELRETMHLSAPRISTIVDELEKEGMVERRGDASDRRITCVYLTSEGLRREKAQRDRLGDYVNRTVGALSETDQRELERLLKELADRTMAMLRDDADGEAIQGRRD